MIKYHLTPFELLTNAKLYDIMALREKIFTFEQKCTEVDLDGLDKNAIHVAGYEDGKLFAIARILPPGVYKKGVVSFGRLAIKKDHRGKRYSKAIMETILRHIKEHYPRAKIEFSAQEYLQKFYENFGFKKIGETYNEGGIPHIRMSK